MLSKYNNFDLISFRHFFKNSATFCTTYVYAERTAIKDIQQGYTTNLGLFCYKLYRRQVEILHF